MEGLLHHFAWPGVKFISPQTSPVDLNKTYQLSSFKSCKFGIQTNTSLLTKQCFLFVHALSVGTNTTLSLPGFTCGIYVTLSGTVPEQFLRAKSAMSESAGQENVDGSEGGHPLSSKYDKNVRKTRIHYKLFGHLLRGI